MSPAIQRALKSEVAVPHAATTPYIVQQNAIAKNVTVSKTVYAAPTLEQPVSQAVFVGVKPIVGESIKVPTKQHINTPSHAAVVSVSQNETETTDIPLSVWETGFHSTPTPWVEIIFVLLAASYLVHMGVFLSKQGTTAYNAKDIATVSKGQVIFWRLKLSTV